MMAGYVYAMGDFLPPNITPIKEIDKVNMADSPTCRGN